MVDARAGSGGTDYFWTPVEAQNIAGDVQSPSTIYELETATSNADSWLVERYEVPRWAKNVAWISGLITDYDNNTKEHAQYVGTSAANGGFTIYGTLNGRGTNWSTEFSSIADLGLPADRDVTQPDPALGVAFTTSYQDWYALPLMAGQTVNLSPNLDLDNTGSHNGADQSYLEMYVLDPSGRAVAVWGGRYWAYLADYPGTSGYSGEWSFLNNMPGQTGAGDSFALTAGEAGVYYIVWATDRKEGSDYKVDVVNANPTAISGVNVETNYDMRLGNNRLQANQTSGWAVWTENGGSLGAVTIGQKAFSTNVYAMGGGDLISYQANELGALYNADYYTVTACSDGNIGRVASLSADPLAYFVADLNAGMDGFYNNNAYIQDVYAASDMNGSLGVTTISATGSIGVIEVAGSMCGNVAGDVEIYINSDNAGPSATIDLIDVQGNWTLPILYTGTNGDIRDIHVGGTIYQDIGGFVTPEPVTVDDGTSRTFYDDSGGSIVFNPGQITEIDAATGKPIMDPATGKPKVLQATRYQWFEIDVADKVGAVLTRLEVDGPFSMTATGARGHWQHNCQSPMDV